MPIPERFKGMAEDIMSGVDPDTEKNDASDLTDDEADELVDLVARGKVDGFDESGDGERTMRRDAPERGQAEDDDDEDEDEQDSDDGIDEQDEGDDEEEDDGERKKRGARGDREPSIDDLRRDNGRLRARLREQQEADARAQTDRIARLEAQIREMAEARKSPPEPEKPLLSQDEIDLVGGPETAAVIERLARQIADRRFGETIAPISKKLEGFEGRAQQNDEAVFIAGVRARFPEMDGLGADKQWQSFVTTRPPGVFYTWGELLMDAHSRRNFAGVADVLETYRKLKSAARSATGRRNDTQQQPRTIRRADMGDYAAPARQSGSDHAASLHRIKDPDGARARWADQLKRKKITPEVFRQRMLALEEI